MSLEETDCSAKALDAEGSGLRVSVLVVDDEPELLDEVLEHLERLGYLTFSAADGESALAVILERPDIRVCLTDLRMPGSMSGMDLMAQLHAKYPDRACRLSFIMFTGQATLEDERAAVAAGALQFLRKPCSPSEITEAVSAAIRL